MADEKTGVDNPAFSIREEEAPQEDKKISQVNEVVASDLNISSPKVLTPEERKEKSAIMKNIIFISVAFTFLFTSYNSMVNLQSSINKVDGTAALTAVYGAFIFSCCFLPSWTLKVLKEKHTMAVSMLCYTTYMMAQFYPTSYTLIPSAVIMGLGAAPLWSAKCTYLTKVGTAYAELLGESADVEITRFFGIFFTFFQSTQVWGNLISSSVLSIGVKEATETNETALLSCGYNFRIENSPGPSTDGDKAPEERDGPPLWQIYTMASIFVACAFFSSITTFIFVDPLSRFKYTEGISEGGKSNLQMLVATFNHMRHPYQILIIPLTIWSGVEQAFLGTDFTAAYVSCGLGVHMVGYIMVFYGVCDALCSFSFTPLLKRYGRVPLFSLGFIINLVLIITFIYWLPHPDDLVCFFIIAGLWGVADAVWQTQINAFYGVIFRGESEAGFSNYRLWESTGFFIAYVCSTILYIESKITILLIFLLTGIAGYYTIEAIEKMGGLKKDQDGKVIRTDVLIMKSLEAVLED